MTQDAATHEQYIDVAVMAWDSQASMTNFPVRYAYSLDDFSYDFSSTSKDFLGSGGFAEVYKMEAIRPHLLPRWYWKRFVAAKIACSGHRRRIEER